MSDYGTEHILGMNVLEFILVAWVACIFIAWLCDFGPEIIREKRELWEDRYMNRKIVLETPKVTPENDLDKTVTLAKARHEMDVVFVIRPPKVRGHGRHARV